MIEEIKSIVGWIVKLKVKLLSKFTMGLLPLVIDITIVRGNSTSSDCANRKGFSGLI